jgi:hypothetical protein
VPTMSLIDRLAPPPAVGCVAIIASCRPRAASRRPGPSTRPTTEPGSTVYVRVPPSLKRAIDQAAGKAGVSVNAWAMQCLERCLGGN